MGSPLAYLELMRPRQWLKNAFVAAPLFFSLNLFDADAVIAALWAVAAFCLVSGAAYIENDVCDVEADRVHPRKSNRPLARRDVTPMAARAVSLVLILCAAAIVVLTDAPWRFAAALAAYMVLTDLYSWVLKRVALVELFALASGYVIRVIAGCMAIAVQPSPWILGATGALALFVVTGKRRAELQEAPDSIRVALKGYTVPFLDSLLNILAGLTLALYVLYAMDAETAARFGGASLLPSAVFVAFGVFRYLQVVRTGEGVDDPTEILLGDHWLQGAIGLWVASLAYLIYS